MSSILAEALGIRDAVIVTEVKQVKTGTVLWSPFCGAVQVGWIAPDNSFFEAIDPEEDDGSSHIDSEDLQALCLEIVS